MKKYLVSFKNTIVHDVTVEVEAASEAEAIKKAKDYDIIGYEEITNEEVTDTDHYEAKEVE